MTPSRLLNPTVLKTTVARTVQVTGVAGIPDGAIAVTGNLAVVNPASAGYVAVTSAATNAPKTSTLNFPAHDTRANAVTVPLGPGGKLGFTYVGKSGSSAEIIFDVTGYFLPGASGASYFGVTPSRLLSPTVLKTAVARTVQVTGVAGIPDGAIAVTGNLAVVNPASAGYVSVTSAATNAPKTSTLNFPAHDTRANAVTVPLGTGGKLGFTYVGKSGSSAEIVFDVTGYFLPGASGASYFGVTPSRLLRPDGSSRPRLAKTVQVTGVADNPRCRSPDGAMAVTGNLAVVNPSRAATCRSRPSQPTRPRPRRSTSRSATRGPTRSRSSSARAASSASPTSARRVIGRRSSSTSPATSWPRPG